MWQVRLSALKREEDAIAKDREALEATKLRHIRCEPFPEDACC